MEVKSHWLHPDVSELLTPELSHCRSYRIDLAICTTKSSPTSLRNPADCATKSTSVPGRREQEDSAKLPECVEV